MSKRKEEKREQEYYDRVGNFLLLYRYFGFQNP